MYKLLVSLLVVCSMAVGQMYCLSQYAQMLAQFISSENASAVSGGLLLALGVIFFTCSLGQVVLTRYIMGVLTRIYIGRLSARLSSNIDEFYTHKHDYHSAQVVSDYSTEVARGQITVINNLATGIVNVMVMVIISLYLIYEATLPFLVVSVILTACISVLILFLRPLQRKLGERISGHSSSATVMTTALFESLPFLLLNNAELPAIMAWSKKIYEWMHSIYVSTFWAQQGKLVFELVIYSSVPIVIYFGQTSNEMSGEVFYQLILIATVSVKLLPGLNSLSNSFQAVMANRVVVSVLFGNRKTAKSQQPSLDVTGDWVWCVDQLVVSTSSGSGSKEPILKGCSFELRKGDRLAVVGPSGSGKSTLIKAALSLISRESGCSYVNSNSGGEIKTENFYRAVGNWQYVPQRAVFFPFSVVENFEFFAGKLTNDQVLALEKFVLAFGLVSSKGEVSAFLQKSMKDYSSEFSGGELQRLALIRSLLLSPEVLILDEATSALDVATQETVIEFIHSEFPGLTMVTIAHRIEALRHCNRLICCLQGNISYEGNYSEDVISEFFKKLVN